MAWPDELEKIIQDSIDRKYAAPEHSAERRFYERQLMPWRRPAVRCFRGAMLPTSATGNIIPAHMAGPVPLCREGQQREPSEIGVLVGAMRRDGLLLCCGTNY
jgi:hypothetical protein